MYSTASAALVLVLCFLVIFGFHLTQTGVSFLISTVGHLTSLLPALMFLNLLALDLVIISSLHDIGSLVCALAEALVALYDATLASVVSAAVDDFDETAGSYAVTVDYAQFIPGGFVGEGSVTAILCFPLVALACHVFVGFGAVASAFLVSSTWMFITDKDIPEPSSSIGEDSGAHDVFSDVTADDGDSDDYDSDDDDDMTMVGEDSDSDDDALTVVDDDDDAVSTDLAASASRQAIRHWIQEIRIGSERRWADTSASWLASRRSRLSDIAEVRAILHHSQQTYGPLSSSAPVLAPIVTAPTPTTHTVVDIVEILIQESVSTLHAAVDIDIDEKATSTSRPENRDSMLPPTLQPALIPGGSDIDEKATSTSRPDNRDFPSPPTLQSAPIPGGSAESPGLLTAMLSPSLQLTGAPVAEVAPRTTAYFPPCPSSGTGGEASNSAPPPDRQQTECSSRDTYAITQVVKENDPGPSASAAPAPAALYWFACRARHNEQIS